MRAVLLFLLLVSIVQSNAAGSDEFWSDPEVSFAVHVASLANELESGSSDILFWKSLSGLLDREVSVWSFYYRTAGRAVEESSCESSIASASLAPNGDCRIWQIRQKTKHPELRKSTRVSMRVTTEDGQLIEYECFLESELVGTEWKSSYWTLALADGAITARGEFPATQLDLMQENEGRQQLPDGDRTEALSK